MTKHILIFGGSGFIGKSICREAIKQQIPVISLSRSGAPSDPNYQHPLITWVKVNVFEDEWQEYLIEAFAVINLIGILHENPQKKIFYADMIVIANQLIADHVAKIPNLPYLFLSANANGPFVPKAYLENKRQAEAYLAHLTNPVIIFRPGLVVGTSRPFSLIEGSGVYLLAHLPFLAKIFRPVYPITSERLAKRLIQESFATRSKCLTPDNF